MDDANVGAGPYLTVLDGRYDDKYDEDAPPHVEFALTACALGGSSAFVMLVLMGPCRNNCLKLLGIGLGVVAGLIGALEFAAPLQFRSDFRDWDTLSRWNDDTYFDSLDSEIKACTYGCIVAVVAGGCGVSAGLYTVVAFVRSF